MTADGGVRGPRPFRNLILIALVPPE